MEGLLQGFKIQTDFLTDQLRFVRREHVHADYSLQNHLGRSSCPDLPHVEDMSSGSSKNGPASFKSFLAPAHHIAQLSLLRSPSTAAYRGIQDLDSVWPSEVGHRFGCLMGDRAVNRNDRSSPRPFKDARFSCHNGLHLSIIHDGDLDDLGTLGDFARRMGDFCA